jgi:hypothetical protein
MSEWKFRLAEPADAPAFSKWSAENPQIEQKDLIATLKAKNPTCLFFVAEEDGVVISFAPVYCQFALAHLAFNPEANGKQKMRALNTLLDGVMAFAVQYGIREITTLSKPEYGVAKWAVANGFVEEERQLFKFDINKVLEEAKPECAPVAEK